MNVTVRGQPVRIDPKDRLGGGTQGEVYRFERDMALKVYNQVNTLLGKKLEAMVASPPAFRNGRSARPVELAYNGQGTVVGFVMPKIQPGYAEIAELGKRSYRKSHITTSEEVTRLFLDGYKSVEDIHGSGYIIGDFSKKNEDFQGQTMLFLDVDAYQFDKFICPVGTEETLNPRLYGKDLSTRQFFIPDDDWYSFAVLLFQSLLMTHPYGGTHPKVPSMLRRAEQHLFILGPNVTYPQIAFSPDVLSDDLLHFFTGFFTNPVGKFPKQVLEAYLGSLTVCPNCGATFPANRPHCPVCQEAHTIQITSKVYQGVTVTKLIETQGAIFWSKWVGGILYAVAEQQGEDTLYRCDKSAVLVDGLALRPHESGRRWDILAEQPIFNNENKSWVGIAQKRVETDSFRRKAIFRTKDRRLYTIQNGALLESFLDSTDRQQSHAIRSIMPEQTWFTVRQDNDTFPTIAGFFQVFRQQQWWMLWEGQSYDNLGLTPLDLAETQQDVLVRFDSHTLLILRLTDEAGVSYQHLAVVDARGKVTNFPRKQADSLPHGATYAHGVLIVPTDDGLEAHIIAANSTKLFTQTKGLVDAGSTLYTDGNDVIVVRDHEAFRLHMN